METPALDALLRAIDLSYDRKAWHGPTLRGALRGVDAALADWRPAPGRHTIREIYIHGSPHPPSRPATSFPPLT